MTQQTREEWQLNKETADAVHSRMSSWRESADGHLVESGQNAIKAAGIANGGAAVAMLALIGNALSNDAASRLNKDLIAYCFAIYIIGLALSAFAAGLAYVVNYCYLLAYDARRLDYEYPYIHDNGWSKAWTRFGACFHVVCALFVVGSYCLFVYGSFSARELLIAALSR